MNCGLIIGIEGPELTAADRARLRHEAVVGVILFARNYRDPGQLAALTGAIRALREPRLLVCVDQEGGRVQRFREGFTSLPALRELGRRFRAHAAGALDLAYRHGRVMAAEVLGHGVDLSLAPVLDLGRAGRVIGDRAFADDPAAVTALAGHYIAGMRDAGMKCCGKHFPGHGSVAGDTHDEFVRDPRSREELADDLRPFRELAAELDAMMPAHVCFPRVDREPAGFSSVWLRDVLRRELGFRGIVVSDDLDMAGAKGPGAPVDRLRRAEAAGCDLALLCCPDAADAVLGDLPADADRYRAARAAAGELYGRAAFTLAEQDLVPEFRAWKRSLERMTGE